MSISADLAVGIASAAFSGLLTIIVSYIAWRGKGVLAEINKNTQFRRYMAGSEEFDRDNGELEQISDQFDNMRRERQAVHRDTHNKLNAIEQEVGYLGEFVREMAGAINRSELDESVPEPEGHTGVSQWQPGEDDD